MDARSYLSTVGRRHRTFLVVVVTLLLALAIDYFVVAFSMWSTGTSAIASLWAWFNGLTDPEPWFGLVALTFFLAFANLYLKIALQAPNLQRRLRPSVFLNVPFAIYCSVYLLISILAFTYLRGTADNPFVAVVAASLIGIGLGNADVKFGGFSLLPLSEFLQGLEGVVQVGIGVELSELDVAKRARLRDDLARLVPIRALERECRILGVPDDRLREMFEQVGDDDDTKAGLLAREIVAQSEANARRITDDWWRPTRRSTGRG